MLLPTCRTVRQRVNNSAIVSQAQVSQGGYAAVTGGAAEACELCLWVLQAFHANTINTSRCWSGKYVSPYVSPYVNAVGHTRSSTHLYTPCTACCLEVLPGKSLGSLVLQPCQQSCLAHCTIRVAALCFIWVAGKPGSTCSSCNGYAAILGG